MAEFMFDDQPVLDADQIAELLDLDAGAGDLLTQIANAFEQQTETHLATLRQLSQCEKLDLEKIGTVAHAMCSGAGSVGARRLCQLCLQMEVDCRAGNASSIMSHVANAHSEFAATRSALAGLR